MGKPVSHVVNERFPPLRRRIGSSSLCNVRAYIRAVTGVDAVLRMNRRTTPALSYRKSGAVTRCSVASLEGRRETSRRLPSAVAAGRGVDIGHRIAGGGA